MAMTRRWFAVLSAAVLVAAGTFVSAQQPSVDAAFKRFWDAKSPQDAAKVAPVVVASGVSTPR
jgi:hypothetical protein